MDKDSPIVIYENSQDGVQLDVRLDDGNVWLNQAQIAQLFGKARTTITEHISNIFREAELDEKVVCQDFRHTTQHAAMTGATQQRTQLYSLSLN